MASSLFKVTVVQHWLRDCWIDADGRPCDEGAPGARFVKSRKVKAGTPGAKKVKKKSGKWYGRLPGSTKPIPLSANKVAAQQMLAAMVRKAELERAGIIDPFEAHRKRPLGEHLDEWEADLRASGASAKHVSQTVACARRVIGGCKFAFMADLSPSRVQQFLAGLRERRPSAPAAPVKESYTRAELAKLLGVKASAVTWLVRKSGLQAMGNGKARRYPRATAEALLASRARGRSVKTANLYLAAVKQFAAWLVRDRRMAESPLAHLAGGNVKVDRRHDRRALAVEEIRLVIQTARQSAVEFRGLTGPDRAVLYTLACASGFRASELA